MLQDEASFDRSVRALSGLSPLMFCIHQDLLCSPSAGPLPTMTFFDHKLREPPPTANYGALLKLSERPKSPALGFSLIT